MKEKNLGKSIKKKLLRLLKYALFLMLGLVLIVSLLFQLNSVQTSTAKYLAVMLTKKTHATVNIRSLNVNVVNGIEMEGFYLADSTGSPMIRIGKLKARINLFNILRTRFHFRSLEMDTVDFNLLIHKNAPDYAFVQFVKQLASQDTSSSEKPVQAFVMQIKQIDMKHVRFWLKDENIHNDYGPNSMDYEDLDVSDASLQAHDFRLVDDSLNFFVDRLSGREKSGFVLKKLHSHIILSGKTFYFKGLEAETNHSHIAMDYFMDAAGWGSYAYFIDSVKLRADFKPSVLYMPDIGYFANSMFLMKDTLQVKTGLFRGVISNFQTHDLYVSYGQNTRLLADFSIKGFPDFYTSRIHADIQSFTTMASDLKAFTLPLDSMSHLPVPIAMPEMETVDISGNFNGSYYNFISDLQIKMAENSHLSIHSSYRAGIQYPRFIDLKIEGTHFPLGLWVNKPLLLGNGDFHARFSTTDTLHDELPLNMMVHFDKLRFNGYNYINLDFEGKIRHDSLFTNFKVLDPHLDMDARGIVSLNKKASSEVNLMIRKADFRTLNIWRGQDFHLKTNAWLQWKGFQPDSMLGKLSMHGTVMQFNNDVYSVNSVELYKTIDSAGDNLIQLKSDILDLKMAGYFELLQIGNDITNALNHYFPVVTAADENRSSGKHYLKFRVDLYRPKIIGEHFVRGLSISPNTWFSGDFDFGKNGLVAEAYSKKLQYQGIDLKQNYFKMNTDSSTLSMMYHVGHIILKDSTKTDKSVFGLDSMRVDLNMRNDSLLAALLWNNEGGKFENRGNLKAVFVKSGQKEEVSLKKSEVVVNDSLWQVDQQNKISHDHLGWKFNHFIIRGGQSQLAIEGRYPKQNGDSLNITFNKWNLSNLDLLWQFIGFDLDGIIDGNVAFTRADGRNARLANLYVNHLALNHVVMGDARIMSTWDNIKNSAFIKSQIIRRGNSGRGKVFDLAGFYYPYRDTASLDLKLNFNHLNLKSVNPFFSEYVSQLEGVADGELNLHGTTSSPDLTGFVNVNRSSLVVNYLNTRYSFSHKFLFRKDTIDFGKIILYDTLGNKGLLTGNMLHHQFHDARLNLEVRTPRLLFFNTDRSQNDLYYGQAIASGKVSITGPVDDIQMNMDVATEKGTSVILPLDYSTEIPDKDYIVFKPPKIDSNKLIPTETILNIPPERSSQYAINLNMAVQPNARLKIYLPSNIGDLESTGSGNLSLNTNSAGDLSLTGDYVVNQGAFNFTLANLVKKHFELVKGGRISWVGNPYKATVNIKGLYKVKVNLNSLGILIDSTTTFRNRVNVNCYVVMSKDLFNPDIRFEIKFPNLDPDLQRMVYAQIDTSNQAVMNQQMISLLVMGTFNFNNPEKVSLSEASYNLLSNQLSSMLSKISKDFDIGFNYKPGDKLSQEEFELALSTQLFDERLIINGNFGMSYDRQNRAANNLVGDVDVGYKLTKDGRWMLKAYNHSNVNSWYYYNNYDKVSPYTQGVGIAYQKEFNKLGDLFRKKRKNKKEAKQKTRPTKK